MIENLKRCLSKRLNKDFSPDRNQLLLVILLVLAFIHLSNSVLSNFVAWQKFKGEFKARI